MTTTQPAPATATCAYCRHTGPAALFGPFNTAGNLACLALAACALRQADAAGIRPALDVLARVARKYCGHGDLTGQSCGCRYQLAARAEAAYGLDFDSAALLAAALWAVTPLA